jgi:hypothetical protein
MTSKGQAAIEYLATYGWMILAVALVGGTIYSQIPEPCNFEVRNLKTDDVVIRQIGVNEDENLAISFQTRSVKEVKLSQVKIQGNETIYSNRTVRLSQNPEAVELGKAKKVESCRDYNFTVIYQKGVVPDIKQTVKFRLPIILDKVLIPYLFETGGEINELNSTSTIKATNSNLCIGRNCPDTEKEEKMKGNYVNRSGDQMTGTLKTNAIKWKCIGGNCKVEKGNNEGYLTNQNNTIDGTLNLTEIKPKQNLCMGKTC